MPDSEIPRRDTILRAAEAATSAGGGSHSWVVRLFLHARCVAYSILHVTAHRTLVVHIPFHPVSSQATHEQVAAPREIKLEMKSWGIGGRDPRFFHDSLVHKYVSSVPRRRTSRINKIDLALHFVHFILPPSPLPAPPRLVILATFLARSRLSSHSPQRATVHGSERPGAPRALRAALRPGCPYVPDGVDLVGAENAWLFESSPSPLSSISAPKLDAFKTHAHCAHLAAVRTHGGWRDGAEEAAEERRRARSGVCAFGQAAAPPHLTTESVGEWAGDGRQSEGKSKKEAGGGRRGHAFCLEKNGNREWAVDARGHGDEKQAAARRRLRTLLDRVSMRGGELTYVGVLDDDEGLAA
ncbi:hypothetical protein DFH08DRAFT_953168 [Mycena albidolilacea]|uniref:Uncharacterized protein n=1 Tax=Mycena albidolilacea TaxID=1033008 RepID=A0AAD7AHB8_9AGAR|nr:hypothetical protein DFH08DRAFT_953168 [Mycena albidolilacea]